MAEQDTQKSTPKRFNEGPARWFLLALALVLIVGVLGFLIDRNDVQEKVADVNKIDKDVAGEMASNNSESQAGDKGGDSVEENVEVRPGNPVVAKFEGKAITRQEVYDFADKYMQGLAAQLPKEQLFPIAVEQLVTQQVLLSKARQAGMSEDPEIQQQIERQTNNILRTEFLKQKLDERITEEKLRDVYEQQIANQDKGEEVKARHILVETEQSALDLIAQLDQGADFAALAKEHSTGPTGARGGDLGYFGKGQMVPEFEEAAFELEEGAYTAKPVKTQFGYHVIFLEDRRDKQPPAFEEVKDQIKDQLMRAEAEKVLSDIREEADVEIFNINGEQIQDN